MFSEYDPASFNLQDLIRLRKRPDLLTQLEIKFLLSYAKCDEVTFLRESFKSVEVNVKRNIAGFTGNHRRANEWLISNAEGRPNPKSPRRLFDPVPLNELKESIRCHGVLVPFTAYKLPG